MEDAVGATEERSSGRKRALVLEVADETRWSFTPPRTWLSGVLVNLVLSLAYLVVVPLTGHHRGAWVVLVGTYFANFILADVTTTNIVGSDPVRIPDRLARGESIRRLLLVKNLTLMIIVGLPTLALTAWLTISDGRHSLLLTLPAVAFPVLCWLAVGDIASVLLAVRPMSMRHRWATRHDLPATARWLTHLALPYGLFLVVQVLRLFPHTVVAELPRALAHTPAAHGLTLTTAGIMLWVAGLSTAAWLLNRRGLRLS